jgi:hypothetical protein
VSKKITTFFINKSMKIAKFVYRVVYKKGDGYYMYYLQEENNKLYFISSHPASFFVNSPQYLDKLVKQYEEATKLPIINFEDIKTYTNDNIDPIVYPPLKEEKF